MADQEPARSKHLYSSYVLVAVLVLVVFAAVVDAITGTGTAQNYALWTGNTSLGIGNLTENATGLFYNSSQVCTGDNGICGNGSGSGSPGGADRQIQFNDAGSFGATSNFTIDKNGRLNLSGYHNGTLTLPTITGLPLFVPSLAWGDRDTGISEIIDDGQLYFYLGEQLTLFITQDAVSVQGGPRLTVGIPTLYDPGIVITTLDLDTGIGWENNSENGITFIIGGRSGMILNDTSLWMNETIDATIGGMDTGDWTFNSSGIYYAGNITLARNGTCSTLYSPNGANLQEACN